MDKNYRIDIVENNLNNPTVIKVIGVGNGGCNAVNRMVSEGFNGVEFIAMNTDAQSLSRSNADRKIMLGVNLTKGLGAGTNPERGAEAAKENIAEITEIVKGADLVFVASTLGGGTGTGAAPVVADAARKSGALTIGVVTKPFEMEGSFKMKQAVAGIEKMSHSVDSLIIIPNENLYKMSGNEMSLEEGFSIIDDILRQGVQGISDIITQNGFGVNVDFADVKTMISISDGRAHLGIGIGKGDARLEKAIKNAFDNPLLDVASIKNSKGILANIVHPTDFTMKEYKMATEIIHSYANKDANIKIGTCKNEDLKEEVRITIVATGFDANKVVEENKDASENISIKENVKTNITTIDVIEDVKKNENKAIEKRVEELREKMKSNNSISSNNTYRDKDNTPPQVEDLVSTDESNDTDTHMEENTVKNTNTQTVKKVNTPFEVISENEMLKHTMRGNGMDIYDNNTDNVDYDTPAFLRRGIQTRKNK